MIDQADPDAPPGGRVAAARGAKRAQVAAHRRPRGAAAARCWPRTWRVEVVGAEHLAAAIGGGPDRCIYAIWHGRILPMHVVLA